MYSDVLSIVNVAMGIFCVVYTFLLIYRTEKDAPSVGDMLFELLTHPTTIASISRIDATSISVSIVADWTGYAEQCFFNETMEGALAMALEHKAKCEKRKDRP